MRPWYKKKRFILGGIFAIIVIAAIAGNSGGGSDGEKPSASNSAALGTSEQPQETTTTQPQETTTTVSPGLGSADAAKDVELTSCTNEPVLDIGKPVLKVTNNSSKRSDYFITVAVETDGGKTQVDTALATVSKLEPGQAAEAEAFMAEKIPDGATCRIIEVQRTAST